MAELEEKLRAMGMFKSKAGRTWLNEKDKKETDAFRSYVMQDDHIPFMQRGVPSADLIDFDYGYNDVFWHTTQDTMDKLSPKSLEIVGVTMLETVRILDKMDPLPPK